MIDGEIVCLDRDGRSNFRNLLFRREWPHFAAFDLLGVNGEDLRHLPLLTRKARLRTFMPRIECRTFFVDHIAARGRDFYQVACEYDLEGIVGKWARKLPRSVDTA